MNSSVHNLALQIGWGVRHLRLSRNQTQTALASEANVSLRALKNLEHGTATLRTLVNVLHALGRDHWLTSVTVLPLADPAFEKRIWTSRQRARPTASE